MPSNELELRYRTQWASQFFASGELTRRGYLVAFTLGNAPAVDLLVVSPQGSQFKIDVKGLSSKNAWFVREREPSDDLFYVFVLVAQDVPTPEFFIMTSTQVMKAIHEVRQAVESAGRQWTRSMAGFKWGVVAGYKDKWDILPQ